MGLLLPIPLLPPDPIVMRKLGSEDSDEEDESEFELAEERDRLRDGNKAASGLDPLPPPKRAANGLEPLPPPNRAANGFSEPDEDDDEEPLLPPLTNGDRIPFSRLSCELTMV